MMAGRQERRCMPAQRIADVPIESLRFGLSPRNENHDPEHAAALVEVLDKVPPILVHTPTLRVIDGVHRVEAARLAGRKTLPALMFDGDETLARIEAVRSNILHGKPLTLAERESAAVQFLGLVPDWSDRRIADVSGLSPATVARLRDRATADSGQLRARVGRDGRVRPLDPSELRQRIADAITSEPEASNRAIARRTAASPATVRDVRERLQRGENPVPARLRGERRGAEGSLRAKARKKEPRKDCANVISAVPARFAAWFEARRIRDTEWQEFVDDIPIGRVYEVADATRRQSERWHAFAVALEDRARRHRRS